MDDLYEGLKTVHVLAAVIWVGGAFYLQALVPRVRATSSPDRLGALSQDIGWLGQRIFLPASLILVITGFWMVAELDLEYEEWIIFGIVVWTLSFISGAFFLGPEGGRLGELIEREGMTDAAQSRLNRILVISRVELVLLILVVIAMVAKIGA